MDHVVHLDSAAAGRTTAATRAAVSAHLNREAEIGAYVAESEALPVIEAGRADLADLLGVPSAGVAFVESASMALAVLLTAWPLRVGDVVAVVPSEWGPNLAAFADAGLRIVELGVDPHGLLDLDRLTSVLTTIRPAFVHLTHVASHRGLVQPVAAAAALCRDAGVPLWVDAAQAIGHVRSVTGADVIYATSRKWLAGPRGVGVLAVSEPWWGALRFRAPAGDPRWNPLGRPLVHVLESAEANIAGRVGLAAAVRQHVEAGPSTVEAALQSVGRQTRAALADVPGWAVLPTPEGAASAITALRPTAGADVFAMRARLLERDRIVTTACGVFRAPREMTEPLLRISPKADVQPDELEALARALAG
jgi:pyridoxal 5-phosphate dependent beta-lyase